MVLLIKLNLFFIFKVIYKYSHNYIRTSFLYILASEQLAQWDRRIESFCVQVNQVLDKIQAVHPDWCQKTMASIEAKINAATNDDENISIAEQPTASTKPMDTS